MPEIYYYFQKFCYQGVVGERFFKENLKFLFSNESCVMVLTNINIDILDRVMKLFKVYSKMLITNMVAVEF